MTPNALIIAHKRQNLIAAYSNSWAPVEYRTFTAERGADGVWDINRADGQHEDVRDTLADALAAIDRLLAPCPRCEGEGFILSAPTPWDHERPYPCPECEG